MRVDIKLDPQYFVNLMTGWIGGMENPDEPLIGVAGSSELISPNQLVVHVRDETPIGTRYIQDLADVAVKAAIRDHATKQFGSHQGTESAK